jgi:hypothetical protein
VKTEGQWKTEGQSKAGAEHRSWEPLALHPGLPLAFYWSSAFCHSLITDCSVEAILGALGPGVETPGYCR